MTTPYMPYFHFTADCTRISDQTPNKHETSSQCYFIVGPPSATLAQHKQTLGHCLLFSGQLDRLNYAPAANWWEAPFWWEARGPGPTPPPPLDPALQQTRDNQSMLAQCCITVYDASPTPRQPRPNTPAYRGELLSFIQSLS